GSCPPVKEKLLDHPVVVVASLTESEVPVIVNFLKTLGAPIYAEAISQLRGIPELEALLLSGGEKSVQKLFEEGFAKSVLRLGGVPTLRLWRDLEEKFKNISVVSVSPLDFTGLSRRVEHFRGWKNLEILKSNWSELEIKE